MTPSSTPSTWPPSGGTRAAANPSPGEGSGGGKVSAPYLAVTHGAAVHFLDGVAEATEAAAVPFTWATDWATEVAEPKTAKKKGKQRVLLLLPLLLLAVILILVCAPQQEGRGWNAGEDNGNDRNGDKKR